MKQFLNRLFFGFSILFGWLMFGSWNGGLTPCKSDSLAIIRVITPINELFDIEPVVIVSAGTCRIEEVKVNDAETGNGELVFKQTLTNFLANGYVIQTSIETIDNGLKLNTYYLKKKGI